MHGAAGCPCSGSIRESKPRSTDTGVSDCAPPVDEPTGGAQWIKNVCFFLPLCLGVFSRRQVLRGYGGLQAAAALPQFALVAVQRHLLQGGGGGWRRRHLGLRTRCAPWEKERFQLEEDHFPTVFIVLVEGTSSIWSLIHQPLPSTTNMHKTKGSTATKTLKLNLDLQFVHENERSTHDSCTISAPIQKQVNGELI